MKLIFVTGGVISGLGKGITAASMGRLLKSAGYSISVIKMDPYLNVDAGTMSPFEHGEVFVTDDGFETDLDLGHYERFIDIDLSKKNSITSGTIYTRVLENERQGNYLGKTIQVIPHVVDEVKKAIMDVAQDYDVTIIEIGGTIGDIEGPHFMEAARQMKHDIGKNNVLYAHVVPLLYLSYSKEFKTKPIQHSYKELTRMGIQADMLICRSDYPMPQACKDKISLFCDVDPDCVIENINCTSIYEVPALFQKQSVDTIIQQKLGLESKASDITGWVNRVNQLLTAQDIIKIGIVGKYTRIQDSYISVVEALHHAAAAYNVHLELEWIHTEDFERTNKLAAIKQRVDGLLIPGGFGTRGMEGKIQAAAFAMKHKVPYLGLCLGLQMAVIAFARYHCGLTDAHSLEADVVTTHPVISFMPGQSDDIEKGGTMRLGSYDALLSKGTTIYDLYKDIAPGHIEDDTMTIAERHRHRYEVNPVYVDTLQEHGLTIAGSNPAHNLVEFIELADHPFFVATQAHPEFKSRLDRPHPLFYGFVGACV